jgi:hypothetical protein
MAYLTEILGQVHTGYIEYYPHITMSHENAGVFNPCRVCELDKALYAKTEYDMVEYIFRNKHLIIKDNVREYAEISQQCHMINNGLYIVYHKDCIDANKFPVLNQYDMITKKHVVAYTSKYFSVQFLTENAMTYARICIQVIDNDQFKKGVVRHIADVLSLLQQ